jgi:ABC-type oligopeptide transport system ATPase subunit
MCDGKTEEQNSTPEVFQNSSNSYTKALLSAIPSGPKTTKSLAQEGSPLLEVEQVKTYFTDFSNPTEKVVKAVDDVSLSLQKGEILGLVGESGSGKSTLGRSILQLAPLTAGTVRFSGTDLSALQPNQLIPWRRKLQMIFQDPYASLNPRMTVYQTLAEPLLYHGLANKKTVAKQVEQLMDDVGLARSSVLKYPHEFSGGQRQRIAIGRAIATEPEFIIADEPVSALDVTIQAQILDLILDLVKQRDLTMLFISHDLSVVRHICDRVAVMHQGKLVEEAPTEALWANPKMDYTRNLLSAIPTSNLS